MNCYQIRTRILHFFRAKHWRGHGIHSPMVYSLVREVIMRCKSRDLARQLSLRMADQRRVIVVDDVAQICRNSCSNGMYCVILREPFRSKDQRAQWNEFYEREHCTAIHCKGWLIVFFDAKLQKQYFCIRS